MLNSTYNLPKLPPPVDLETVRVFKALATANRALAELKGRAAVIPNQGILIDTLALQEAKASSAIENIVTTQGGLPRKLTHQFESIHPFPDGNGRIGRILNVLYLTRTGLLDIPILYLSRHIIETKSDYYHLLQAVRDNADWEDWVLYILAAVAKTAKTTLSLVEGIRGQMASMKHRMRSELPKLYSQDLLNNLFRHPYTRIEFVSNDLHITRQTAAKYLDRLAKHGFVQKHQTGRSNYYINTALVQIFLDVAGEWHDNGWTIWDAEI